MSDNKCNHMQKLTNRLLIVSFLFFSSITAINAEESLLPKTKVVNGEEFVLLIHQIWNFDIKEFLEQNPRYWAYSRAVVGIDLNITGDPAVIQAIQSNEEDKNK